VASTDSGVDVYPGVAVAFEGTSGEALATYRENARTVRYRTWTGSWSGEQVGPDVVDQDPTSMTLYPRSGADEIMLLVEEEGSLNLKVKHFNADFSAWEEKTEHVTFRLVAIGEDVIHFSGLSLYRTGPDEFMGFIAMRYGDEVREEILEYRRRGAD